MTHPKKPQLIVFTDNFPFNQGEPFFEAECQRLATSFELTLISSSPSDHLTRTLDPDIQVMRYNPHEPRFTAIEKLTVLFDFVTQPQAWVEISSILRSGERRMQRLMDSFLAYGLSRRLYRYVKTTLGLNRNRDAILYFYWFNYKPLYFALKLANSNVKLVSRVHGYDLYNERQPSGRQPFRQIVDARLNKVMFVAQTGMNYYLNTFAIPPSPKHEVLYLGSRQPQHLPPPSSTESFVIVSCSNMIPLKRIDRIIEAISKLKLIDRSVHWIHFGSGPLMTTLAEQAQTVLASQPNVTFELKGEVKNDEILRFYQTHPVDCFITLSSSEGLPVSIMEAMSVGIPILATDVGGIKEMLPSDYPYVINRDTSTDQVAQVLRQLSELTTTQRSGLAQTLIQKWTYDFNEETNAMKLIANLRHL